MCDASYTCKHSIWQKDKDEPIADLADLSRTWLYITKSDKLNAATAWIFIGS